MIVSQSFPEGFNRDKAEAEAKRKKAYIQKTAAFREWLHKLNRNEKLPRGTYFKNKTAGKPVIIIDEFHSYFKMPNLHECRAKNS
ncbi:hypothetical protein ACRZ5S_22905 (plasmid) [Vibrio scophthalmi]|uniref:hypothetical protein n=1 Tax=Vibrio scophthalmi TaxID=45658 RepID=UPI003EB8B2D0